jgi:hypothetical protein
VESREGQGWRALGLPVTQAGAAAQPQQIGERDKIGRGRRYIICGWNVTGGVTIRLGSGEGDMRTKGIGMPLGAEYLYLELRGDEDLYAIATSGLGGGVEQLHYRVEILHDDRG